MEHHRTLGFNTDLLTNTQQCLWTPSTHLCQSRKSSRQRSVLSLAQHRGKIHLYVQVRRGLLCALSLREGGIWGKLTGEFCCEWSVLVPLTPMYCIILVLSWCELWSLKSVCGCRVGWMQWMPTTQRHISLHWHTLYMPRWRAHACACPTPSTTSPAEQPSMSPFMSQCSLTHAPSSWPTARWGHSIANVSQEVDWIQKILWYGPSRSANFRISRLNSIFS